ncbi:MAG: RHS repeat-associated core domain-containing protein, partial [Myxococcota bacterium]
MLERDGVAMTFDAVRAGAPSAVGADAMGYDGAGQVTEANGFNHLWDHLGRLVVSSGSAGSVQSVYGADHLRVARHSDGEVTHYVAPDFEVRDGVSVIYPRLQSARIARLESADYARAWLELGSSGQSSPVTAADAYARHQLNDTNFESWLTASARRMLVDARPEVVALHRDQLGSYVFATGDDGQVLGRRSFASRGQVASASGFVDRYGFTGQEHEPHTGLIHFAHRFLSTDTGLWLSPDPAFTALTSGSLNRMPEAVSRYSYVANNPGTQVDATGLNAENSVTVDGIEYSTDFAVIARDKRYAKALTTFARGKYLQQHDVVSFYLQLSRVRAEDGTWSKRAMKRLYKQHLSPKAKLPVNIRDDKRVAAQALG